MTYKIPNFLLKNLKYSPNYGYVQIAYKMMPVVLGIYC